VVLIRAADDLHGSGGLRALPSRIISTLPKVSLGHIFPATFCQEGVKRPSGRALLDRSGIGTLANGLPWLTVWWRCWLRRKLLEKKHTVNILSKNVTFPDNEKASPFRQIAKVQQFVEADSQQARLLPRVTLEPPVIKARSDPNSLSQVQVRQQSPPRRSVWRRSLTPALALSTLYAAFAVSFTPSARATLRTVSKRGFAPGANASYKLSRPRPVSLAICDTPRARAMSPSARSKRSGSFASSTLELSLRDCRLQPSEGAQQFEPALVCHETRQARSGTLLSDGR